MPAFEVVRPVRHTPEQMFDLVADVERYPEFVPLCERLVVRQRREVDGRVVLIADMTAGYGPVNETFTSKVTLDRERLVIDVEYIDGPFRFLENRWRFVARSGGGSDVDFHIAYEFKSRVLAALMGSMFDRAFRKFSEAFEARADRVYASA
jgi:coenzyme Q-binding protein COQ10